MQGAPWQGGGARHARRWQNKERGDMVLRYLVQDKDCCSSRKWSWAVCRFLGSLCKFRFVLAAESLSCVHIRTSSPQQGLITAECVLWKLLWKSPIQSLNHKKLLLLLIIERGNSGNVYGRKPVDFSRFSSLAKTLFSNQCKYTCKRGEGSDQPKGTGQFVDPHINHYKKLVLIIVQLTQQWTWEHLAFCTQGPSFEKFWGLLL